MKTVRLFRIMIVVLIALLMPALSARGESGNPNFTFTDISTTQEKVMDINYQTRKVTLKDEKGSVRTVQVEEDLSNLGKVKIGDEVNVETNQSISVEVEHGPGETMNIGSESQTSAQPGEKPSTIRTIEGKLKTKVESIDYQERTITFKNRKGVLTTYKIGPQAKRFNEIRRGDMLVVDYSQTITLTVK
jgi:hypothetical protein